MFGFKELKKINKSVFKKGLIYNLFDLYENRYKYLAIYFANFNYLLHRPKLPLIDLILETIYAIMYNGFKLALAISTARSFVFILLFWVFLPYAAKDIKISNLYKGAIFGRDISKEYLIEKLNKAAIEKISTELCIAGDGNKTLFKFPLMDLQDESNTFIQLLQFVLFQSKQNLKADSKLDLIDKYLDYKSNNYTLNLKLSPFHILFQTGSLFPGSKKFRNLPIGLCPISSSDLDGRVNIDISLKVLSNLMDLARGNPDLSSSATEVLLSCLKNEDLDRHIKPSMSSEQFLEVILNLRKAYGNILFLLKTVFPYILSKQTETLIQYDNSPIASTDKLYSISGTTFLRNIDSNVVPNVIASNVMSKINIEDIKKIFAASLEDNIRFEILEKSGDIDKNKLIFILESFIFDLLSKISDPNIDFNQLEHSLNKFCELLTQELLKTLSDIPYERIELREDVHSLINIFKQSIYIMFVESSKLKLVLKPSSDFKCIDKYIDKANFFKEVPNIIKDKDIYKKFTNAGLSSLSGFLIESCYFCKDPKKLFEEFFSLDSSNINSTWRTHLARSYFSIYATFVQFFVYSYKSTVSSILGSISKDLYSSVSEHANFLNSCFSAFFFLLGTSEIGITPLRNPLLAARLCSEIAACDKGSIHMQNYDYSLLTHDYAGDIELIIFFQYVFSEFPKIKNIWIFANNFIFLVTIYNFTQKIFLDFIKLNYPNRNSSDFKLGLNNDSGISQYFETIDMLKEKDNVNTLFIYLLCSLKSKHPFFLLIELSDLFIKPFCITFLAALFSLCQGGSFYFTLSNFASLTIVFLILSAKNLIIQYNKFKALRVRQGLNTLLDVSSYETFFGSLVGRGAIAKSFFIIIRSQSSILISIFNLISTFGITSLFIYTIMGDNYLFNKEKIILDKFCDVIVCELSCVYFKLSSSMEEWEKYIDIINKSAIKILFPERISIDHLLNVIKLSLREDSLLDIFGQMPVYVFNRGSTEYRAEQLKNLGSMECFPSLSKIYGEESIRSFFSLIFGIDPIIPANNNSDFFYSVQTKGKLFGKSTISLYFDIFLYQYFFTSSLDLNDILTKDRILDDNTQTIFSKLNLKHKLDQYILKIKSDVFVFPLANFLRLSFAMLRRIDSSNQNVTFISETTQDKLSFGLIFIFKYSSDLFFKPLESILNINKFIYDFIKSKLGFNLMTNVLLSKLKLINISGNIVLMCFGGMSNFVLICLLVLVYVIALVSIFINNITKGGLNSFFSFVSSNYELLFGRIIELNTLFIGTLTLIKIILLLGFFSYFFTSIIFFLLGFVRNDLTDNNYNLRIFDDAFSLKLVTDNTSNALTESMKNFNIFMFLLLLQTVLTEMSLRAKCGLNLFSNLFNNLPLLSFLFFDKSIILNILISILFDSLISYAYNIIKEHIFDRMINYMKEITFIFDIENIKNYCAKNFIE